MDHLEVDTRVVLSPRLRIARASRLARLPLVLLPVLGAVVAGSSGSSNRPGVLRGVAYVEESASGRSRTLDLYLPVESERKPPLVAFVHSRFWSRADGARRLDAGMARPLQAEGVAVAVVRHRLAPGSSHPAHAEDVSAAASFLLRNAARYGYDPRRIFLAGHSSGAHLAALVALDPRYLEREGLDPSALAGVIALSGIYDLDPGDAVSEEERAFYEQAFGDRRTRRAASPLRLVRSDAPRFLTLAAEHDIAGYLNAGNTFAEALRGTGHPDAEFYFMLGRDHLSILDMRQVDRGAAQYLLHFIGVRPLPPPLAELDGATRYWRKPRFSSQPFRERGVRVQSFEVDERFLGFARRLFLGLEHKKIVWRPQRFHAIDLFEYLEKRGAEALGRGPWLVLTNVQNEKTYLQLEAIRPYRPVLVIGVDEVRNLFSVIDVHRAKREYSWRDDLPAPPYLARPMGAFLYFLEPPERPLLPPTLGHFGLSEGSFALSEEDPWAPLRDVDSELLRTFGVGSGCLQCHAFRGVGSRAGHLRALDAQPQGGFALPLVEYPPEVWRRFVFEPRLTAEQVGAPGHPVAGAAAQKLHEFVERERAQAR
jgi:acetyl esterase/lipase